jgi:hypothetical protein
VLIAQSDFQAFFVKPKLGVRGEIRTLPILTSDAGPFIRLTQISLFHAADPPTKGRAMLPTSLDEPALQEALKNIIVKLVVGFVASAGLELGDNTTAAVSVFVASLVAAVLAYIQGKVTRSKVYAPANVPLDALPLEPADGEDVPINR